MPNTRISDLTAATSVAGTDVYPSVQTAGVGPVKTSLTQITAFALANAPAGAVATPSIAPTGDTNTGFWFPAADTIAASTNGSERMRINSSGNVGIGTTPSVWGSSFRAIDMVQFSTRTSGLFGGSGRTGIGIALGCYNDNTNWIYSVTSAPVATYEINGNGAHVFSVATAGTAGNPITFSTAMLINSAGNVGIGTASPASKLHVQGTSSGATIEVARFENSGTGANTKATLAFYAASTNYGSITSGYGASAPDMNFILPVSGAFRFTNVSTDVFTITSAGNVGIGTTSANVILQIGDGTGTRIVAADGGTAATQGAAFAIRQGGAYKGIFGTEALVIGSGTSSDFVINSYSDNVKINCATGKYTAFLGNLVEVARITSAGNLLIGTTSSPTTGTQCLTVGTGTAPTATPADTVTFYSSDLSAGNTIPSIYTEGTGIVSSNTGTTNLSNRIAVRINGTVYYLLAASSA